MPPQEMIRVGDPIIYRSGFGRDAPAIVRVEAMDVTREPGGKYGKVVTEASWSLVLENRINFDMDDGHWAYSDQIETGCPPSLIKKIMREPKKNLPAYMGTHPALDAWIENKLKRSVNHVH